MVIHAPNHITESDIENIKNSIPKKYLTATRAQTSRMIEHR